MHQEEARSEKLPMDGGLVGHYNRFLLVNKAFFKRGNSTDTGPGQV